MSMPPCIVMKVWRDCFPIVCKEVHHKVPNDINKYIINDTKRKVQIYILCHGNVKQGIALWMWDVDWTDDESEYTRCTRDLV